MEDGFQPASESYYSKVFVESYNPGFRVLSKYQCDTWGTFSKESNPTAEQQDEHDNHIRCESQGRDAKDADKVLDGDALTVCFDL